MQGLGLDVDINKSIKSKNHCVHHRNFKDSFNMATSITGLKTTYKILIAGNNSRTITKGTNVTVHALGSVLKADGSTEKFWDTKDAGQEAFRYQAGMGGVITGWDQGCLGMGLGESRELTIPGDEGYGAGGFPAWGIPPNGTLHFVIECLKIE